MNNSQYNFDKLISQICEALDFSIENANITDKVLRQKLFTLSSFVEFMKAGADIQTAGITNNVVAFKVILK